jgi:tetratricopeptide (TPR) repeat protein
MEPDKLFPDSASQTALQEAELAALLRMLSISEGTFSLSLAICNSPALREYLIGKIEEAKADIEIIPIEKDTSSVLTFVEKKINNKRPSAIFVSEIEKALPSDDTQPKVLRTLNASRELWQEKFSCPVVFWLPEYAATLLSIHARDLWSWVSHTFEFVSEQATADGRVLNVNVSDALSVGDAVSVSRLDADQKRLRIAELKHRIADAKDLSRPDLSVHVLTWLNELAFTYLAIGELDKAEKNIVQSLHTAEKLRFQAGIAAAYGNLGLIYRTRGDLDNGEQMHRKSLEIAVELNLQEIIANQYSSLGSVCETRGDLHNAEEMHRKALEIDEKLGRREGIAVDYNNLGLVYRKRRDFDKAEQMYLKALETNNKLGRLSGVANNYGNLGLVYLNRGDLDEAERMLRESLEINEKLGRLEGVANQYANLGSVHKQRGDIEKARVCWEKALDRFMKIGMKPEIEKTQKAIDGLKAEDGGQKTDGG